MNGSCATALRGSDSLRMHRIHANGSEFARTGAELIAERIRMVLAERGDCTIGLSGGSTPEPVYRTLGAMHGIDWTNVFVFLIDERMVAGDHADSNQHLVRSSLLASADIANDHLMFPNTSLPHAACADDYARRLNDHFAAHTFDVSILGMGPDGHIASLFPPLHDAAFGEATAIATLTPLDADGKPLFAVRERVTLTLPALRKSTWSLMLLGPSKQATWDQMERSNEGPNRWPVKAVLNGNFTLLAQDA